MLSISTSWALALALLVSPGVDGTALEGGRNQQLLVSPTPSSTERHSPLLNVNETANFVLNSLTGALAQLPNTIHSNGHLLLPVTIPRHTLLYHARNDNLILSTELSPEWVAMDSEMSFAIMAGRSSSTWLSTFSTQREMKLIYFDGMSAALGTDGWNDSQDVLVALTEAEPTPPHRGAGPPQEMERAVRLCNWSKKEGLGLNGFLRMNSGFEIMWCDFGELELVSHLNISPPDTPTSTDTEPRPSDSEPPYAREERFSAPSPVHPSLGDIEPPHFPEGSYPHRRPRGSLGGGGPGAFFSSSLRKEWLRVSTRRYRVPQPHIVPDWSSFVTFYHPRLTSLVRVRKECPRMADHQIKRYASKEDVVNVMGELLEVLQREKSSGSGVEWGQLGKDVIERYGDRLAHLKLLIAEPSSSSAATNFTLLRRQASLLSYTMLNPFFDTTHLTNTSDSSIPSFLWLPQAVERCSSQLTRTVPASSLTRQEELLKASIEFVTARICSEVGAVFEESLARNEDGDEEVVKRWRAKVNALMDWLDWPMWTRCEEACGWDEVCAIPMWPANGGFPGGRHEPDFEAAVVVPYCLALFD